MRHVMFVIALVICPASTSIAQSGDSLTRAIDRVFESWRDTDGPGCAVGVSRDGNIVLERGYGMANLETDTPIRPSSIFHVASVSKQFTAAAIMLLERDGKLSLDDNIRKYLPEIPDYGTPITIRHLLTHTSGLRDQWELLAFARGRSRRIASPKPMSWTSCLGKRRSTSSRAPNTRTAIRDSPCWA